MSVTTQPYVLCLDGDDWVEPRYLQLARDIFESRQGVGIVSAWVRFEGMRRGEWTPKEFTLDDLLSVNRIPSASAFRRVASEAVGCYSEDLGGYEDWEHWIAISAEGWKTSILPEMLLHYDWRPASLGRTSNSQARQLVESIVSKHRDLYHERIGSVLGAKHEQVIALETEAREAWKRGEIAEAELQRVWCPVGELAAKLEVQGRSVGELARELDWTRDRLHDLEAASAPIAVCGAAPDRSQPE